jgi:hypothetical protein
LLGEREEDSLRSFPITDTTVGNGMFAGIDIRGRNSSPLNVCYLGNGTLGGQVALRTSKRVIVK